MKSVPGVRSWPFSKATTFRPALVTSRAMMAPVQPSPIVTASTSFNRVTMSASPLGKVRDRLRLGDVAFVAIFIDEIGVGRRQAGKAEHSPRRLVAVAAIDRIAEEAFHGERQEPGEEGARIEILERGLALFHRLERLDAFVRIEPVEIAAVSLARPGVGSGNAGGEELGRRQRQLIALLGLAFEIGAGAIHLGAAAPGAGQLAVDIGGAAAIAARGR